MSFGDQVTASIENTGPYSRPLDELLPESMPNAPHQLGSSENLPTDPVPQVGFFSNQTTKLEFGILPQSEVELNNLNYQLMHGSSNLSEDYNLFLDDYDMSNFYLPSSVFDSELPTSLWVRPDSETVLRNWEASRDVHSPLSRFSSRLPSLQPDEQDPPEIKSAPHADRPRTSPPWKISSRDHKEIQMRLVEFGAVLPEGFTLPSRHALSQFFEGYISGFNQHLPFLHVPTLVASKCAPELLLAIVAVGAQYRFESNKGNNLWYAARAIAFEQTRRRHSQKVADILSSPTPKSTSSTTRSPMSTAGTGERPVEPNHVGAQFGEGPRDPNNPLSVTHDPRLVN